MGTALATGLPVVPASPGERVWTVAKIATPRLKDVAPSAGTFGTICDRLTEVGTVSQGGALTGVRVTVRSESGALSAALMLTVANGEWADVTLAVTADADPSVSARVNRLLDGYTVGANPATVGSIGSAPKLQKYWRTKQTVLRHQRWPKITALPALAEGKPHVFPNGTVALSWTKRSMPLVIEDNQSLGYQPVSPAKPSRPARRGKATASTAPKAAPIKPLGKVTAPPSNSAKTAPKKRQPLVAQPLPAGHPGIFQMPNGNLATLRQNQMVLDDLSGAVHSFMSGDDTVALLRGPTGAGKTLAAQTVALQNGLPFRKFDVYAMRDFADWTGAVSLHETPSGNVITDFAPSLFAEAIRADGPYGGIPRLVLLDEFTRAETAGSQAALFAIFDSSGSGPATLYVPDARKSIVVDPAVMFVLTANIGAEFTGTLPIDSALQDRVTHWIVVDYPNPTEEATILVEQTGIDHTTAKQFVSVGNQIRAMRNRGEIEFSISTRGLVSVANKFVTEQRTKVDSFRVGFIQRLSAEGGTASEVAKVTSTVNATLR